MKNELLMIDNNTVATELIKFNDLIGSTTIREEKRKLDSFERSVSKDISNIFVGNTTRGIKTLDEVELKHTERDPIERCDLIYSSKRGLRKERYDKQDIRAISDFFAFFSQKRVIDFLESNTKRAFEIEILKNIFDKYRETYNKTDTTFTYTTKNIPLCVINDSECRTKLQTILKENNLKNIEELKNCESFELKIKYNPERSSDIFMTIDDAGTNLEIYTNRNSSTFRKYALLDFIKSEKTQFKKVQKYYLDKYNTQTDILRTVHQEILAAIPRLAISKMIQ